MKNVAKVVDTRGKSVESDDDMVRRCPPLPIACGDNKAYLHLSRMLTCKRSAGVCVRHAKSWLTPNEFQAISGRKAAKDWKRSIKHHGKSLKLLMSNGTLTVLPPACKCETCLEQTPDAALVSGFINVIVIIVNISSNMVINGFNNGIINEVINAICNITSNVISNANVLHNSCSDLHLNYYTIDTVNASNVYMIVIVSVGCW